MHVDKKIEVEVPVETVYDQWTQFEDFPQFMAGIREVHQLSEERLHWVAEVGGARKEWYARITRQVPDEVLAWESEGGATNSGTIIFRSVDPARTEIEVHLDYDPVDIKERAGGMLGVVSRRVKDDLERFKEFVEVRGLETGAWRGEIIHGANIDDRSQLYRKRSGTHNGGRDRVAPDQDGGGDQIGTTTESLDLNREQAGQTEEPRRPGALPSPGGS
jgi:hypothetical protein